MKKLFQILSAAIIIILISCGIQDAEIRGALKNEMMELSANGSSPANEPDILLIDAHGQILFNADPGDQTKKIQYRPSSRNASYTIDRSERAKTLFRLRGPYGVN